MSTERAFVPLDADLEEDTDLPPPAPGLRSPIADHSFDPPTLPGIVAPHRLLPLSDRLLDPAAVQDLSARIAAQRFAGAADTIQFELKDEKTLRMPVPMLPPEASEPTPMPSGHPAALPPPPHSSHTPTPTPTPTPAPALDDSSVTPHSQPFPLHTQSTKTLPEIGLLPPLPPTPEYDSLVAGLRYSRAVFRSLRKRRLLQEQLRAHERAELDALDRALLRLGQRAYTDQLDLLSWHPLLATGGGEQGSERAEASRTGAERATMRLSQLAPPSPMPEQVEIAAARLQALAQTELAARARTEAQLQSELLHYGRLWRTRQADLFALEQRTRGLPQGHPLHESRQEAAIAVAQATSDIDELAQRLGHARADRLVHERAYAHAQPPVEQLAAALSPKLAAAQRKAPHLLVLGALLCTAGLGIEPPGVPLGSYSGLWQRVYQLQHNLALRQTLLTRLELDQQTYDRDAIRRTALALLVLAVAVLCSVALVVGVVSMR